MNKQHFNRLGGFKMSIKKRRYRVLKIIARRTTNPR